LQKIGHIPNRGGTSNWVSKCVRSPTYDSASRSREASRCRSAIKPGAGCTRAQPHQTHVRQMPCRPHTTYGHVQTVQRIMPSSIILMDSLRTERTFSLPPQWWVLLSGRRSLRHKEVRAETRSKQRIQADPILAKPMWTHAHIHSGNPGGEADAHTMRSKPT